MMLDRFALAGLALFAVPTGALVSVAEPASSGALPTVECVAAVRAARLAEEQDDTTSARQKYEAASALPSCELPALSGLLSVLHASAFASASLDPGPEWARVRDRLAARLGDPATEVPRGLLTQLANLGLAGRDPQGDGLLASTLERRLAAADREGRQRAGDELEEELEVLAELQLRVGRHEEARATLERLFAVAPSEALRWRIVLLDVDKGRWESAEKLLAGMIRNPDAPEFLRYLHASALANLGRYDELLVEIERLAPPPPAPVSATAPPPSENVVTIPGTEKLAGSSFASLLISTAWSLRDAGRDAEAANFFRRALVYEPQSTQAHAALLHLYGTAEERSAAATAAAVRRESETDPQRLFEEGSDLLAAGDAAGARELLARAAPGLSGSHYEEPAWYNFGTAAFKLERWEEAASAYEHAIAVNAERAESHFKRGIALHNLKRCREAVDSLRQALTLDAGKRDAHYYLSACYSQLGDAAEAARESALFNQKPQ